MAQPDRIARLALPAALLAALLPALLPAGAAAQTDTDIHLLELRTVAGRLTVAGPPRAVTDRAGYDNQPQFTPGGRLLYTSIRSDQADTYLYEIGDGSRPVTRTPESEYSPTPIPGAHRFSVVRVEADSAQRLWSFAPEGTSPALLLPDIAPVGYHAWIREDLVALFVLGEPPTLQIARVGGEARVVAEGIGRSIQAVPGTEAITFTQAVGDGWWIREYDTGTETVRNIAPLPGPDGYHAWVPDGTLLTAHGSRVLAFDREAQQWRAVVDLAGTGIHGLSRLAVSDDGKWLAVVAER